MARSRTTDNVKMEFGLSEDLKEVGLSMEPFFNSIQNVKSVRFGESSHMPHLEESEEFLKVVDDFLSMN